MTDYSKFFSTGSPFQKRLHYLQLDSEKNHNWEQSRLEVMNFTDEKEE